MDKQVIKTRIRQAIESDPSINNIKRVSLFGSYVNGTASMDSDVDVLVEFKPSATIGFFKLAQIQRNLGNFIGKRVDLLTPESLSKFFREKVINEAEIIYEE